MSTCPTFPMFHSKHGECVADDTARPGLEACGWSIEKPGEEKADDLDPTTVAFEAAAGGATQEQATEAARVTKAIKPPKAGKRK